MGGKLLTISEELADYIGRVSLREPAILQRLREETSANPMARMQITPEQGQFLAFLVQLTGAKKTLEVGVFTGYSSLWVMQALPADGHITACDVSEEWTSMARRYWREAGVDGRIDLHLAPAAETLRQLLAAGLAGTYDFAFIDADKENYDYYYECALQLVRRGGLITIDNVLWSGRVIDPAVNDTDTLALRALNEKLHTDERISLSMLSIGDGLTLACKR